MILKLKILEKTLNHTTKKQNEQITSKMKLLNKLNAKNPHFINR